MTFRKISSLYIRKSLHCLMAYDFCFLLQLKLLSFVQYLSTAELHVGLIHGKQVDVDLPKLSESDMNAMRF